MPLSGPTPLTIDENGRTIPEGYRHMVSDNVTVVTAGTKVNLATSYTEGKRLDITNPTSNSAAAYIGGSGVKNAAGGPKGTPILPNNTYTFYISDLSLVWADADANGVVLTYNYFY